MVRVEGAWEVCSHFIEGGCSTNLHLHIRGEGFKVDTLIPAPPEIPIELEGKYQPIEDIIKSLERYPQHVAKIRRILEALKKGKDEVLKAVLSPPAYPDPNKLKSRELVTIL